MPCPDGEESQVSKNVLLEKVYRTVHLGLALTDQYTFRTQTYHPTAPAHVNCTLLRNHILADAFADIAFTAPACPQPS